MCTAAPSGVSWAQYVRMGGASYIDSRTGLLAGPWAECLSWGVRFEHSADWSSMPEYVGQDGPVGGILTAFEVSLVGRPDGRDLLDAARRLEEASHAAEAEGRPLPGLQTSAADGMPIPGGQGFEQQLPFGQQKVYSPQPPYGQQLPFGQQAMYGQQPAYGEPYGYGAQQLYQQPSAMGGPTLLEQQHHQSTGMGTGAKVAMAAAGGLALGAGAFYAGEHLDEIGQAMGDAGQWVAGAAEDVGGFVGDAVDDVF